MVAAEGEQYPPVPQSASTRQLPNTQVFVAGPSCGRVIPSQLQTPPAMSGSQSSSLRQPYPIPYPPSVLTVRQFGPDALVTQTLHDPSPASVGHGPTVPSHIVDSGR
jgi:hypothetical protein